MASVTETPAGHDEYFQRMKLIETQIETLQAESRHLVEQRAMSKKIPTEQVLRTYAQSSCRELCTALQSRLPRELRDEIYSYFCSSQRTILVEYSHLGENLQDIFKTYQDWHTLTWPDTRDWTHVFNVEYVGQEMMHELMQTALSKFFFHFNDICNLERFLNDTSLGGVALVNYLRGLVLDIDNSVLREADLLFSGAEGRDQLVEQTAESLCRNLQALFAIKRSVGFVLDIDIIDTDGEMTAKRWQDILKCIRPLYFRFLHAGFEVTVHVERLWKEDVMALLELEPEEWPEGLGRIQRGEL